MADSKWIPITERLPGSKGAYIVSELTDDWDEELCSIISVENISIRFFDGNEFHTEDDVTAWMPLPEPYKPEVKP